MGSKKAKNKKKNELKLIFFIILVSAVLFVISTYAWFSTQRNVSITNLSGTVEVAEGLEISLDAKSWSNSIVLGSGEGQLSIIDDAYDNDGKLTNGEFVSPNLSPSEMLPVSTLAKIDYQNNPITGLKMLRGKLTDNVKLSTVTIANETLTEVDDNIDLPTYYGYFSFDIFLKNSSKNDQLEDILQLNYDSSLEILEAKNAVTGLQNTARIAFVKYGGDSEKVTVGAGEDQVTRTVWNGVADTLAEQVDILTTTGAWNPDEHASGKNVYITDAAIWEPNADDHAEYIVTNNNKITWTTTDGPKYGTLDTKRKEELTAAGLTNGSGLYKYAEIQKMPTYALDEEGFTFDVKTNADASTNIADVYDWSGTNATILNKQVALQTTSQKRKTEKGEYYTDEEGNYVFESYRIAEGVQNLISTTNVDDEGNAKAFTLPPNSVVRLRVYVWLEGQDVDCINYASHGGGVKLNIGLVKGSEVGTKAPAVAGN